MTTRRLGLLNTLALLLIAGLCGLVGESAYAYRSSQAVDSLLRTRAETLSLTTTADTTELPDLDASAFTIHPFYVQLQRVDGAIVARSANLGGQAFPVQTDVLVLGRATYANAAMAGHALREYVMPVPAGLVLGVATPTEDPIQPTLMVFLISGLFGLVVAVALGWLLAQLALTPIEQLAGTVRGITSTEDLTRRVPGKLTDRPDAVGGLAREINGMLGRLQEASERLAAALEAQRRFVADASHELRTPLTSLRGNVHLLIQYLAEQVLSSSESMVEDILNDMSVESERMSRMVDGLLVLARADAEQHLSLTPTPVNPLLRTAFKATCAFAEGVEVGLATLKRDVSVAADADRLIQVLLILLDNAVRYTPPGGHVQLGAVPEDRGGRAGVLIEVTDSGAGVPAAERERIFERFYRGTTSRGDSAGAGLGLAVARWIIQEHHGSIEVHDAQPAGSTFTVWLPKLKDSD